MSYDKIYIDNKNEPTYIYRYYENGEEKIIKLKNLKWLKEKQDILKLLIEKLQAEKVERIKEWESDMLSHWNRGDEDYGGKSTWVGIQLNTNEYYNLDTLKTFVI